MHGVGIGDDDIGALRLDAADLVGLADAIAVLEPFDVEPSITMPPPSASCAWAIVLSGPATTRCLSKPITRQSHSIAAGASR